MHLTLLFAIRVGRGLKGSASLKPPASCRLGILLPSLLVFFALASIAGAQVNLPVQWQYTPIQNVQSVSESPDGSMLAAAGGHAIQVFSVSTGLLLTELPLAASANINSISFSPDGSMLAVGGSAQSQGLLQLWKVSGWSLSAELPTSANGQGGVSSVVYSTDSRTLVSGGTGSKGGVVEVWNVLAGTLAQTIPTSASNVNAVAISSDGSKVAVGGASGSGVGVLEVWNRTAGSLLANLGTAASSVNSIVFEPSGGTVVDGGIGPSSDSRSASNTWGVLEVWSVATKSLITSLGTNLPSVSSVSLASDGATLAATGLQGYNVGQWYYAGDGVEVWDLATRNLTANLWTAAVYSANSVSFSSNGSKLNVGGLGLFQDDQYSAIYLYPVLEAWDLGSQTVTTSFNPAAYTNSAVYWGGQGIGQLAFSPDGKSLATGDMVLSGYGASRLQIWNAASGEQTTTIYSHALIMETVGFSFDGSMIADGGFSARDLYSVFPYINGYLELWNAVTGASIASFPTAANGGVSSIAFTSDGKTLVDGGFVYGFDGDPGSGIVEIWDLAKSTLTSTINSAAANGVNSVAISPDQTLVADCGSGVSYPTNTGIAEVWNLSTGNLTASANLGTNLTQLLYLPTGGSLAVIGTGVDNGGNTIPLAGVWEYAATGSPFVALPLAKGTTKAVSEALSKDGKTLYVATDIGIQVFDLIQNTLVAALANSPYQTGFNLIALSPDNGLIGFMANGSTLGVASNPLLTSAAIVSGLTLNPSSVSSGSSSTGTVQLSSSAPSGGFVVPLNSGSAVATVPSTVTVPQGATSASFSINTTSTSTLTTALITAGNDLTAKSAILTLTPSGIAGITVSPTTLTGGQSSSGIVTLFAPARAAGATIALSSDNPSAVAPATVVVPAGMTSASFTIKTLPVGAVTSVTITASMGPQTQSATLVINPAVLSAFSISPTSIKGGNSSQGTITLNGPAGASGIVVPLSSNNAAAVVPQSISVSPNASTATFQINSIGVNVQTSATIAAGTGAGTKSANLTITPAGLSSVSLNPNTVGGGSNSTGTVLLDGPAGHGGTSIGLSSSSAGAATPPSVVVQAGKTSASFTISTSAVNAKTSATIQATLGSQSQTAVLTINPAALLSISLNPTSVVGGLTAMGTVTLSAEAGSGGFLVNVKSNNAAVVVPATVTVPSGLSTATFTIMTTSQVAQQKATISANAGSITQTAVLTVIPASLGSLTVNPSTVAGTISSAGTVNLTGPAPSGGLVVSLSSNSKYAKVPATVSIGQGLSSGSFEVKTSAVTSQTSATITASLNGADKAATLTIALPWVVSLTLSPSSVAGGSGSTGKISLSGPAIASGMSVALTSSLSSATVPASVKIEAGKLTANFSIKTIAVGVKMNAVISGRIGSTFQSATLAINPPAIKSLTLRPNSLVGGSTSTATLSLTSVAPLGGMLVQIQSSSASAAVPSSVTIAAGKTILSFPVKTSKVTSTSTVSITATGGGTTKTATLTIKT